MLTAMPPRCPASVELFQPLSRVRISGKDNAVWNRSGIGLNVNAGTPGC